MLVIEGNIIGPEGLWARSVPHPPLEEEAHAYIFQAGPIPPRKVMGTRLDLLQNCSLLSTVPVSPCFVPPERIHFIPEPLAVGPSDYILLDLPCKGLHKGRLSLFLIILRGVFVFFPSFVVLVLVLVLLLLFLLLLDRRSLAFMRHFGVILGLSIRFRLLEFLTLLLGPI